MCKGHSLSPVQSLPDMQAIAGLRTHLVGVGQQLSPLPRLPAPSLLPLFQILGQLCKPLTNPAGHLHYQKEVGQTQVPVSAPEPQFAFVGSSLPFSPCGLQAQHWMKKPPHHADRLKGSRSCMRTNPQGLYFMSLIKVLPL